MEILPVTVPPGALQVRLSEVMTGLNGDSTIQFVELEVNSDADKLWGPQSGETAGRAMLAFFDETGSQIGRFVFPSNAPAGGTKVLVATRAFSQLTGLRPDFFMPAELSAIGGKVAFMANPDNLRFTMNIALSYGGSRYFGLTGGAGPANTNEASILGAKSLTRTAPVPFGVNLNSAFSQTTPTPQNSAGQTATLTEAPLRDQGRTIFSRETFRGNGRTCATCHIANGRDQFGLTAMTILGLPEEDPLFVFEQNVNVMKLVLRSQPSDLRGPVTGTLGSGRVLVGSGDSYQIIGGTNLAGLVSDTNGNLGILQTVTPGSLSGPTSGNGSPRGLEDHPLLEHGRGLILENIDGFKRREVFRASPHLLNIALTAPYGLSGEFSNLDDFSVGAVIQHFPRTLGRVSGMDFRHPTRAELAAMTEFMNSIYQPSDGYYDLDRFATTEAQKRGRTLFFNNEGKCSKCHSGPTLNLSDGSLFGSISNANMNFNTGVANLLRNLADGLPTEPAGLMPGQSTRNFNTPSLMGVRLTAPFFHDSSVPNLKEAVEFYDTEEFLQSPAGQLTGTILAANREEKVADLVAFLESLVEVPVEFTRNLSFGVRCPGAPIQGPLTATISNLGAVTVAITNVAFNGTNAADFNIVADTGQTSLAPGQSRTVTVAFSPAATGGRRATLEFTALETNLLGRFEFGVALSGADVDNIVTAAPASFEFGTRDIDAPPSPEVSLLVTNDGSSPLDLSGFTLAGATPQDFVVTADTSPLAPHDVRVIQVSFAPRSQGAKSASIQIPVLACNTALIDIPLTGAASSTVHHFGWDPVGSTQYVGTAFAVRVSAQDRNNDTVAAFGGAVRLMSVVGAQTNAVLIAPTNSAPFVNGMWIGSVTVQQPATSVRLLARDNQGHTGVSDAFLTPLRDDVSLVAVDSPDPVLGGQAMTYSFTVHNTGPTVATGVTMTDTLPAGISFVSGNASQGMVTHSARVVSWQLGSLSRGLSATGRVVVLPEPGFASVTNLAVVTRNELEANLANNLATNVTSIQPFGLLTVTPETNFESAGFSGGPFAPTNQTFVVSNAGNASLDWQVRGGGCNLPSGLVSWWPGEGNALDVVGTNHGSLMNGASFAPGMVGQGFLFDGINDFVLVNDSPTLDLTNEITVELWYKLHRDSGEPLFDKRVGNGPGNYGAILSSQFGIEVFYNDPTVNDGDFPASGVEISAVPPPLPPTNLFHHFAATFRQLSSNFVEVVTFVDADIVRTRTMQGSLARTINDVPFSIGAESGSGAVFAGIIDEVSLYNRALSAAEIQAIVTAGASGKCSSQSGSGGTNRCNLPDGLVSWWPFDGITVDSVGTNDGTLVGNPAFTNGFVGQALFFDGVDDGVRVPVSAELNFGTNDAFSFETWFNVPSATRRNPLFEYEDGSSFAGPNLFVGSVGASGAMFGGLVQVGNVDHPFQTAGGLFIANSWNHAALTYNRITGILNLYLNGAVVLQQNIGTFVLRTTGSVFLGRRNSPGFEESLQGHLDEPTFYRRELSAAEVQGIFLAGAVGKCPGRPWLTVSPTVGSLEPGATTNVALSINTNSLALPVGTHSDGIAFTNLSNGRGSTERIVLLNVLNRQPTFNPLLPLTLTEDSGPQIVMLTGITAGGGEIQNLIVTAALSNPSLIASPITVNYTSPATTGSVMLTLVPNAHGTAAVSVVVRDDAGVANGALDAVTNTFLVTVTPVDDPPTLVPITDRTINEGTLLLITNILTDPDLPEDQHVFSLIAPPSGAAIGPSDGVFTWQPGEDQGPSTNQITIVVRDGSVPPLSATNRFTVVVLEVNSPPVLTVPANRTVLPGVPVSFSVSAADSDLPANGLTFSLGVGAPPGASINGTSGLFSWTPPPAPVPGTNVFTFMVTDNGAPAQSDQKNVSLVVVSQPVIESITTSGGMVTVRWSALAGLRYRLLFKSNLGQASWTSLPGDVVANGSTATKSDSTAAGGQRFYRVTVLP
ncbi:MAG TPA: LamG-like jellyroll fold domain-containing protein [Verrucomicrobiae bacterium]|nr:LamG-like jellyroll fold domain-containing protein [Verrucomicrobiae bacterium]